MEVRDIRQERKAADLGLPLARLIYGSSAAALAGVFALASRLTPVAGGIGTHTQLGLPACRFLSLTGIPCPSCGMTTCFALAAHGRIVEAIHAQPFGLVLFVGGLALTPLLLYRTLRPVPVGQYLDMDRAMAAVKIFLMLYVAGWVYKLAVTV